MGTVYIGVDISKLKLDVCCEGRLSSFANEQKECLKKVREWKQNEAFHVVVEATGGYEYALVSALHEVGVPVSIVEPRRVRRFAEAEGKRAKNDRLDAVVLTRFGEAFHPSPSPKPEPVREKMRELLELRVQLDENLTRTSNQLEATHDKTVRKFVEASIKHLEKQIKLVEKEIEKLREADENLKKFSAILEAVDGVGKITSASLLAFLPELGYLNRQQISALAGLAPYDQESGEWKGKRIISGGRWQVRRPLYMAALVAATRGKCKILSKVYNDMVAKGKPKKVAIIACARKLLVYLNSAMRKALIEAGLITSATAQSAAI